MLFLGLTSSLDYFEDIPIKTLLISPFYPSPKKDNGYDISSYIDIDSVYGTLEDFDKFMTEIKKRGMVHKKCIIVIELETLWYIFLHF